MKQFTFIITTALVLILAACGSAEPAPRPTPTVETAAPAADRITIVAFGDSLTEGFGVEPGESYPAQLGAKLEANGYDIDVVNGGISGETSSGGLSRVDWMLGTEPDIVIVETGGNDGLRGIELSETAANIDEIVRKFDESGVIVIVAGMQIVQNLGEEYTTEFAAIYPTVATKYGTILIPFFLEGVAADPDLNQPDFIHPTGDGYTVIVDNIYPFVVEAIEQAEQQ